MEHQEYRRVPGIDIVARRRASGAIQPFLADIEKWNPQPAMLAARLAARQTSPEERDAVVGKARDLAREIRRRHTEFRAAMATEPPHGRIDDVEHAFHRLLSALDAII